MLLLEFYFRDEGNLSIVLKVRVYILYCNYEFIFFLKVLI